MKFGQLVECDMKNIFLEKSYTKFGGETSPRLFVFIVWQVECYRNILKLSYRLTTCFHLILSFLKK